MGLRLGMHCCHQSRPLLGPIYPPLPRPILSLFRPPLALLHLHARLTCSESLCLHAQKGCSLPTGTPALCIAAKHFMMLLWHPAPVEHTFCRHRLSTGVGQKAAILFKQLRESSFEHNRTYFWENTHNPAKKRGKQCCVVVERRKSGCCLVFCCTAPWHYRQTVLFKPILFTFLRMRISYNCNVCLWCWTLAASQSSEKEADFLWQEADFCLQISWFRFELLKDFWVYAVQTF